jgi:hypothetical protein
VPMCPGPACAEAAGGGGAFWRLAFVVVNGGVVSGSEFAYRTCETRLHDFGVDL